MENRFLKKRFFVGLVAFICCTCFMGCITFPEHEYLVVSTPRNNSHSILNLRNISDLDASLLRQSEKIMKSGFLDTSTDEYGYFSIRIYENYFDEDGWPFPIMILTCLTAFVGYPVWALLGVPTASGSCYVNAELNIYDSNHVLLKSYEESARISKQAGLYYSGNMTKKAAEQYTRLFESILSSASMQSSEINRALRDAGPVSTEKENAYRDRLATEKTEAAAAKRAANPPSSSYDSYDIPSYQGNNTPAAPQYSFDLTKAGGLYGTYRSSAGGFMVLNYGTVSFTSSDNKLSTGRGSISGNTLSISYTSGPLAGNSFTYTINSSSSFSNRGETYSR